MSTVQVANIHFESTANNRIQYGTNTVLFYAGGANIITANSIGLAVNGDITMSSTSLISPATAGTLEYDGKVLYMTPQGTQRGVVPGMQFYSLNTNLAGVNGTANQSIFGVGTTLSSSTIYRFQLLWHPFKTAGTTSHTMAVSFGGTANVNWIAYESRWNATTAYNTQAAGGSYQTGTSLSPVIITSARTSANEYASVRMAGLVSINSGGTLIPQYSLSAAPGGAYTVLAGSWMEIYPVGTSGANLSVGTWA